MYSEDTQPLASPTASSSQRLAYGRFCLPGSSYKSRHVTMGFKCCWPLQTLTWLYTLLFDPYSILKLESLHKNPVESFYWKIATLALRYNFCPGLSYSHPVVGSESLWSPAPYLPWSGSLRLPLQDLGPPEFGNPYRVAVLCHLSLSIVMLVAKNAWEHSSGPQSASHRHLPFLN